MKRATYTSILLLGLFGTVFSCPAWAESQKEEVSAKLVDGFARALFSYAEVSAPGDAVKESFHSERLSKLWQDEFSRRGIDPAAVARRLTKALNSHKLNESLDTDMFARYRRITLEHLPVKKDFSESTEAAAPFAMHAYRLDVIEDYDDWFNDDVYMYFITTHDDMLWGKVTGIYKDMDEGSSVFLNPKDRGVFGPKGEKIVPKNHTIIDIGVIESDGDDIKQLQKISDAIVDLALVALTIADPKAGASAAQAREETKNLLRLVVELDDDDRLATDSVYFTPSLMAEKTNASTIHEFSRTYERNTFWSHFAYRLNFRLLK